MPKGALYLSVGAHGDQAEVGEPEDGSAENLVSLLDRFPAISRFVGVGCSTKQTGKTTGSSLWLVQSWCEGVPLFIYFIRGFDFRGCWVPAKAWFERLYRRVSSRRWKQNIS